MTVPFTYAISSGVATDSNFEGSRSRLIEQVKMLAVHEVSFFQIREKNLSARNLHTLAADCARVLENTGTRLLVNDRADIAASVGAFGVHLASNSLPVNVVRDGFGNKLAVFVSTHSSNEVENAFAAGAGAVVFGPIFPTPGKSDLVGLDKLRAITESSEVPVIAIGGFDHENCRSAINAGAAGIAGIRAFADAESVQRIMTFLRNNE